MDRFATNPGRLPIRKSTIAVALGTTLIVLLAACGNTGSGTGPTAGISAPRGPAPVSLVKSFGAQSSSVQKIALNSGAIAKAVDRYRINKKAQPSPYQKVGVDLNGDGRAEALVYLTGENWCAKTGCTLAIFRSGQFGYRAISTIRRVKLPVRVGAHQSQGWRDLIVNTGGAGMPEQTVALKFTGRGYPGNATTLAPLPQGVPVEGRIVLDGPPVSMGEPLSQGVAQHSQPISLQP